MTSPQLENLNAPQLEAVTHNQGPILVLAGAGSGKTRVLTRRVANLILEHSVRPEEILAVTFTNKATEEMRERLRTLLGQQSEQIWIATFHSACLRILRRHAPALGYKNGFVVYDSDDSLSVIKQILKKLGLEADKSEKPAVFLKRIDQLKNENISAEDFIPHKNERDQLVAKVYDLYQRELVQANAMDFTDLLVNTLKLLEQHKDIRALYQRHLQHVLVDEFQDTNIIQYKIIRYLAHPKNNLLVVGDDDQSIYAFRGADIRNILSFENDFPDTKVVKLEQNYRSSQNILDAAHEVICKNKERKAKKLWTDAATGEKITCFSAADEEAEADFIKERITEIAEQDKNFRNFAVFYRTNAQSRALEESLIRAKIPYKIFGGLRFYERREIKDILAYLRLIHNPKDNQAFARVLNVPRRGIGAQTFATIQDYALENNLALFEAAVRMNSKSAGVREFAELIKSLTELSSTATLAEVIKQILEKTRYKDQFADKKDPQNVDRLENLAELEHVAQSYSAAENGLQEFLDKVVLTTATDNASKDMADSENYVSLMTLHLAKGLEFDTVFLTGLEEGLLPHSRSIEDGDIAEERRLCYVGITRARKKLFLTHARSRGFTSAASSFGYGGGFRYESRFLTDIPVGLLDYQSVVSEEFYEDAEEDLPEEYLYNSFRRKPKKKSKLDLKGIVSPADKLD